MKKIILIILIISLIPSIFTKNVSSNNPTYYTTIKDLSKNGKQDGIFKQRLTSVINSNYKLEDFNLIEDYSYFTNLHSFPDNLEGSCGFVALSIILGYLDDTLDDNILTEEFNNDISKTTNSLHDTLINYEHYINIPLTQVTKASTAKHLRNTFFDFRRDYIDESLYPRIFVGSHDGPLFNDNPDINSIKNYIDNDIPVIIMLRKFTYSILGSNTIYSSSWHEVVVYGYYDDLFLVHLGWKYTSPKAIINTYNLQSFIAIGDINKLLNEEIKVN